MSSAGDLVFLLKFIGPKSRSLKSSLNRISDLFLFLSESRYFRLLFSYFIGIFAAAGFRGVAFGIMSGFVVLFFELGLEEVERLVHC